MSNHNDVTLKNMTYNGQKVKKWFHNDAHIFSAGNIVTYHVDREVSYWEEVDSGASCLSPNTFTPTKDGWTFLGWREDTTASADVLSSKVMGDEPISLYAVFSKAVKLTAVKVSNNTETLTGYRYYNNGNTINPKFTVSEGSYSSPWVFKGWATATSANAAIVYSEIKNTEFSADTTVYFRAEQTITLAYNSNGGTSGSVSNQTGTKYFSAYNGGTELSPTFTLKANGYSKTYYVFTGWDLGAVGETITLSENKTAYAQWTRYSNPTTWYSGGSASSGYPSNWTVTATDVDCDHEEDCEIYYRTEISDLYANHNEGWSLNAQASGSTGNNQYMEVVVSGIQNATLSINGRSITSVGTYTIDVTGVGTITMYAGLGGGAYTVSHIYISSIKFY